MKQYVIGIDFGTLSGRAILVDAENGAEIAEATHVYPHGVMDEALPSGRKLPPMFALQHPADYLEALSNTVPRLLEQTGVSPVQVAGIGIDFTASTVLPVNGDGTPLCMLPEFEGEPHAYVKLWKHHASEPQANEINALARERGEAWLNSYGGSVSCEWMIPKILEVLQNAPEVYARTDRFTEAGDWITRVLTGNETHSAVFAGYKACWSAESGFPSNDFFKALDPRLSGIVGSKICAHVNPIGEIAGKLNARGAELLGLPEGIPVALPMIDGHAAMPALGVTDVGELVIVIGTSCNLFVNSRTCPEIDGICGKVRDGVYPELYTYEAGQACCGDIYEWFVQNCVPAAYEREAGARGINLHKLLREKAMKLRPGESGLIALDWHNGNRCIIGNTFLSSMMLGMTLQTKAEEIYRAWIEATAFGSRVIMEQLEKGGVEIHTVYAGGGIASKDEMMMQIYADVLGKEIRIAASKQAGALGSTIYAAVAAGIYPDIASAVRCMTRPCTRVYTPDPENQALYQKLYEEYVTLQDYFGRGGNAVMERLKGR